ncbi:Cysteine and histidine-rich domain-containing protein 1 [Erysiphe neolycopersici]|uniref:Cysteine and histidine-rich domain-containing protein 1 n=1 Tax=Erysiphe neolycopersici TaxID=212602 RepID=A0A420HHY5_9PEZI|nr:Cysteine and histidine-rich domain-containing protein 1 [Erysiphe neolycopersici]
MAQKCVRLSCGKFFTDTEEPCFYHPEPPIFHEGKKEILTAILQGWKCCKPRVLTFDEFLSITPCTKGRHSTTDLPPVIEKDCGTAETVSTQVAPLKARVSAIQNTVLSTQQLQPESEDDDPDLTILLGSICKRRSCGEKYNGGSRCNELCCYHPGVPIFHEGSKGYTCCKRRVLEFDEFMKIVGCKTKNKHLFVGSRKNKSAKTTGEEYIDSVRWVSSTSRNLRHDFYQTSNTVIASFFLKNIEKTQSRIEFGNSELVLNLITTDALPKCYKKKIPLFSSINTDASTYQILGTKLEVKLAKTNASSWPTLRSDEQPTGVTIQTGKPGIF